ncbi:hypothetical protein FQA39_LY02957 [Lamprigera yunnana]|nr:hypothetical protein FQA39_LY02957 [Lamprigera yunnana]
MKTLVVISLLLTAVAGLPHRLLIPVRDTHGSRIISGEQAVLGQFPWQVLNIFRVAQGSKFCGGSLISSRWVLTAGHCSIGIDAHKIYLGTIMFYDDPEAVVRNTGAGIVHEDYRPPISWNDVALIDLVTEVEFTDFIRPIKLESRNIIGGETVTASGWGITYDGGWQSYFLNFVDLTTISNSECKRGFHEFLIVKGTLCTVGHPEHSPCSGDSGGPLVVYDDNGEATHVGIASFVHADGCEIGKPAAFARTSYFIPWITEHTGPL